MPALGRAWLLALLLALVATAVGAQTRAALPALTGRVVDAANLLPPEAKRELESRLAAHEARTTDQVVVATVPSLGGESVEDYANRLFRAWGLGQKTRNNGALLLVAPSERKVRIEVGYGLEGALTDALSKVIIATAIAPRFKAGDFPGGIRAGVDGVLEILSGDAAEWGRRAEMRADGAESPDLLVLLVVAVLVVIVVAGFLRGGGGPGRPHRTPRGGWIVLPAPSGGRFGGGFSGGSGGFSGGFSGGGGSSGGGGASGDW